MAEYYGNYNVVTTTDTLSVEVPKQGNNLYYRLWIKNKATDTLVPVTGEQSKEIQSSDWGVVFRTATGLEPDTVYIVRVRYSATQSSYDDSYSNLNYDSTHEILEARTDAEPATCDCWIYFNGDFSHKETLDTGDSYYFGQFFWPYNNTSLTQLQTNLENYLHTVHTYSSFTAPDYDFSIFYTDSDLSYDYTTTSNSITIQLDSITIPDANTYTWKIGSTTQTGSQVTFNSLEAGNYTITLSIKDSRNKEIGKGSVTVSISASNVWIYTSSGWQLGVPYVYTSSGWKEAQAYVYTSSGWKQC